MTRRNRIAITAVAITMLSALAMGQTTEKRIKRADLPSAVAKTVDQQSKGATIRGFSQERENGKTFYEVELTMGGHNKDVLMDSAGRVVEVEEQTPFESLSPAVRDGLNAKLGNGKLLEVEALSKHGKIVAYEAQVIADGKKSEVQVGPDGKRLDHPE